MTSKNTPDTTAPTTDATVMPKEKPGTFSFEGLKSLAILIVLVLAVRWSIASPYYVPTSSMEPTIKVGDRLLAWKLAYNFKIPFTDTALLSWGAPKRGDIIVFKYPRDPSIDYVKRVVAIAGDQVQLRDDVLYINGTAEARVDHNGDRTILTDIVDEQDDKLLFRENLEGIDHWVMQRKPEFRRALRAWWPDVDGKPYTVPEGSVFCMGDNRDNSSDSRVWGEVPLAYVRGRALFVVWSIWTPKGDAFPKLRFDRFGKWLDT
jgi:signal peptidase I